MLGASKEADRCRSDHAVDPSSIPSSIGGSRRRSGQLADYYPLIVQAVSRLERSTAQSRGKIYDRARAAMISQLRSLTPDLNESDIACEQLALEHAIRKVETESLHHSLTPAQPSIRQPDPMRRVQHIPDELATTRNVGGLSRTAGLAHDDDPPGSHLTFARKLAISGADLSAELEMLQREIRHRKSRGSPIVRKLLPVTIMGLLVFAAAASGAH
jgi:hypothetical protein